MKLALSTLVAVAGLGLACLGCNQQPAVDPAVIEQYRLKLVLAEEPDGAQTVTEVRNAMYGIEESAEAHGHDHEPDTEAEGATATQVSATTVPDSDEHADHDHVVGKDDAHDDHDHADEDHAHAGHDHEHAEDEAAHDHVHGHDHGAATAGKKPVVDEMDVVLVGSVGGVPNPSEQSHPEFPFAKNQAVFFLADPEAVAEMEEHEHQHAPGEECSFCAAHAADSASLIAVVQFAEDGKPIPVDARQLFDLNEKETVVVRGKAKIVGDVLTLDATGLYVRR